MKTQTLKIVIDLIGEHSIYGAVSLEASKRAVSIENLVKDKNIIIEYKTLCNGATTHAITDIRNILKNGASSCVIRSVTDDYINNIAGRSL